MSYYRPKVDTTAVSVVTENPSDVTRNKPLIPSIPAPAILSCKPSTPRAMNFLVAAAVNIKPSRVSCTNGDNSYEDLTYDLGNIV